MQHTLVALFVATLLGFALAVAPVTNIPTNSPSSTYSGSLNEDGIAHFHYLAAPPSISNPISHLTITVAPTSGQNPNFHVYAGTCALPGYPFEVLDVNEIQGGYDCESDSTNGCTLSPVFFCRELPYATLKQIYVSVYGFPNAAVTINITEIYALQVDSLLNGLGVTEVQVDASGIAYLTNQVFTLVEANNGTLYAINTSAIGSPQIFALTAYAPEGISDPGNAGFYVFGDFLIYGPACVISGNSLQESSYGTLSISDGCGTGSEYPFIEVTYFAITQNFIQGSPLEFILWIPPTPPTVTALNSGEDTSASVAVGQITYFSFPASSTNVFVSVTPENNSTVRAWVSSGVEYPSTYCDDGRGQTCLSSEPCNLGYPVCYPLNNDPEEKTGIRIAVQGILAEGTFDPEASIQFTIRVDEVFGPAGTATELVLNEENVVEDLEPEVWHDFVFYDVEESVGYYFSAVRTDANGTSTDFTADDTLHVISVRYDRPLHSTQGSCPNLFGTNVTGSDISEEYSNSGLYVCDSLFNGTTVFVSVYLESPSNATYTLNLRLKDAPYPTLTLGERAHFVYNRSQAVYPNLKSFYQMPDVSGVRGKLQVTVEIDEPELYPITETLVEPLLCNFYMFTYTAEYPNGNSTGVYTIQSPDDPLICPVPGFLLGVSRAYTEYYSYYITVDVVDEFPQFAPGDAPLQYDFSDTDTEYVEFALDAPLSIVVEARGQSSKNGLYPFDLVLHSPSCQLFGKNCPGDAEPCFLTVPYEESGESGKWLLTTVNQGSAAGVWVNISLGTDNCRTVYLASSDFCRSEGVQTTSVFTGFTGISNLDYIPSLFTNFFDGLPDASDECVAAAKAYQCNSVYGGCDANGWVPARGTVCLQCRDFLEKCASSGACLADTYCDDVCGFNGSSGSLPADGGDGDGNDGNDGGDGDGSSSASSLKSFSRVLL